MRITRPGIRGRPAFGLTMFGWTTSTGFGLSPEDIQNLVYDASTALLSLDSFNDCDTLTITTVTPAAKHSPAQPFTPDRPLRFREKWGNCRK